VSKRGLAQCELERLDNEIDRVALRALKHKQTTSGFFLELLKAQKTKLFSILKSQSLGLNKLFFYFKTQTMLL
jgi:hypothetical protein